MEQEQKDPFEGVPPKTIELIRKETRMYLSVERPENSQNILEDQGYRSFITRQLVGFNSERQNAIVAQIIAEEDRALKERLEETRRETQIGGKR